MRPINLSTALLLGATAILLVGCGDDNHSNGSAAPSAANAFKRLHPRVTQTLADGAQDSAITVITADKCEILDPHNTESGGDVKVILQVYETLVRIDPQSPDRLIPGLAQSWVVADDARSITFTLRENVKFHDGAVLDAQAAKRSLQRLLGVYLPAPASPYTSFFDMIEHIEADGLTLTLRLNRPAPRVVLRNLTMFPAVIVSPVLFDATGGMTPGQRSTFVSEWASGTGPYYLDKLDAPAARVRLRTFEHYHGGAPSIEKILFRQVPDRNAQLEYLYAGEADMLDDAPREVWDALDDRVNVRLERWWAINICYLGVNVRHDKTRDFDVRRAVQLAVDREALTGLYYGTAQPTHSLVPPSLAEYDPDYRAPGDGAPLPQRQAQARALLEKTGVVGETLNIYYPMHPRPYLPTPEKIADKLRQQLEIIGLKINIVSVPNNELFESIRHGKYELVLIGWTSDNADPDNFYTPLTSGDPATGEPSPVNCGRTFDPQIHEILMRAQALTDAQQRIAAYRSVERRWREQVIGYVPLVNTQQAFAYGPRLIGVEVDPLSNYRFHKATLVKP